MNLREFEKWALAQGSVANPEPDFGFKGECVSLIQQYLYHVCGIKFKARGNAKDWANNIIEGWDKFDVSNTLKAGDILVYTTGKYGHIVIVNADLKCLEQNWNYNKKVTVSEIRKGYSCILRSRKAIDIGNNNTEQTSNSDKTAITYTVKAGDTLSEIALRYNTSVNKLIELNKNEYPKIATSNGNHIETGWILNISNNSNAIRYHVNAKSGLWLLDANGKKIKAYVNNTEVEYLGAGYTKYGYNYIKVKVLTDGNVGYMAKTYLV